MAIIRILHPAVSAVSKQSKSFLKHSKFETSLARTKVYIVFFLKIIDKNQKNHLKILSVCSSLAKSKAELVL